MERKLLLGCIADDFTGASDAASFMAAGGLSPVLCSGIPSADIVLPENCDAVVIALKSRTQKKDEAVADSIAALKRLEELGAEKFYIKYCSTFDSTPEGNIGPIMDAVLEETGAQCSILCPALPANGRTVKDGILYVNGVKLEESSMKDHPLTPMRKSRIAELMAPQSRYESLEVHRDMLYSGEDKLYTGLAGFTSCREHGYIIPDYVNDEDAARIVDIFGGMKVLSGGSGVLTALARALKGDAVCDVSSRGTSGRAIVLAGSCSVATNAQRERYIAGGAQPVRLNDAALLNGSMTADTIWEEVRKLEKPIVYSYETPEGLKGKRNDEGFRLSALIEQVLSGVAARAVNAGYTRVIVAGGETSGAVTRALGYKAFSIGSSVAPGVPVLTPLERNDVRLVLKSGNFGKEDFFEKAIEMTGAEA